ncbi:MAG: hypothetical protein GEU98_20540 [Pseudonocardiaceae bacterium]|nr:hypothetical protein [Pseudonocardiaceae bacterium]
MFGGLGIPGMMSGEQIYDNFQAGNARSLSESGEMVRKLVAKYQDRSDSIMRLAGTIEQAWQGDSGGAAQRGAGPLAVEHATAAPHADSAQGSLSKQSEVFHQVKNTVQKVPPKPEEPGVWDNITAPVNPGPQITYAQKQAEYNAANQHNVDAMSKYSDTTSSNMQAMPTSYGTINPDSAGVSVEQQHKSGPQGDARQQVPDGTGSGTGGTTASGYGGAGATAPGVGGGVGATAPGAGGQPGSLGPPGSTTGSAAPGPGPSGPGVSGFGPSGAGQHSGANPAAGPGMGAMPVGGMAGTGMGGDSARSGRGFGAGRGFGPGGSGAGGSGGSAGGRMAGGGTGGAGGTAGQGPGAGAKTGSGMGGAAAAESAAGRGAAGGTAAGGRGMPMGGMGAGGGRGQGGEDDEHQRASFLVEADPDSTFGTDEKTAPPVIGE